MIENRDIEIVVGHLERYGPMSLEELIDQKSYLVESGIIEQVVEMGKKFGAIKEDDDLLILTTHEVE